MRKGHFLGEKIVSDTHRRNGHAVAIQSLKNPLKSATRTQQTLNHHSIFGHHVQDILPLLISTQSFSLTTLKADSLWPTVQRVALLSPRVLVECVSLPCLCVGGIQRPSSNEGQECHCTPRWDRIRAPVDPQHSPHALQLHPVQITFNLSLPRPCIMAMCIGVTPSASMASRKSICRTTVLITNAERKKADRMAVGCGRVNELTNGVYTSKSRRLVQHGDAISRDVCGKKTNNENDRERPCD